VSVDHYENFPVASFLCPPALRPPITAIYWFARTADDLADEGDAPPAERLADLAAYQADLVAVAGGRSPSERWRLVFEPLAAAIERHRLPIPLLADLLSAFEQDVTKTRYADRTEVLDYCRRSANPIGRLLLHLYGIGNGAALGQSDAICTALQLANFWQDLSVDLPRGRVYVPDTDWQRHGLGPADLLSTDAPQAAALVADLVDWTRGLMRSGEPLVHAVPGRAGWELRLVVQGGSRILDKIEALGYASWQTRPALRASDAPRILWRALTMRPERSIAVPGAAR
jgi:squalene synthase HpnC